MGFGGWQVVGVGGLSATFLYLFAIVISSYASDRRVGSLPDLSVGTCVKNPRDHTRGTS